MNRILVVDDKSHVLSCFRHFFTDKENEYIDFVLSPSEAIKMLKTEKYDFVISELNFNDKSVEGKDILKEAKKDGVQNRIILTAISNLINPADFFATELYRKPISKRKFRDNLLKLKELVF
jgi:DNA-binding NtrC family response regulator